MNKLYKALLKLLRDILPGFETVVESGLTCEPPQLVLDNGGKLIGHYQDFTFKFRVGFLPKGLEPNQPLEEPSEQQPEIPPVS